MDNEEIKNIIVDIARKAKESSYAVMALETRKKDSVLKALADLLESGADGIVAANREDLDAAARKGLSAAMLDRLTLDAKRIASLAAAVREIAAMPDPVGGVISESTRPNGLAVSRVRVPIGVVAIIYESRPNVTIDSFSLAFKAGNTVILRGGSESFRTNTALVGLVNKALASSGVKDGAVFYIPVTDHAAVTELIRLPEYLDLVIPRGGESLIRSVSENSRVPVIKHYKGVCHVYVDASADPAMAEAVVVNSKVQRPGVCNAAETVLVHKDFPGKKRILEALIARKVEIRADAALRAVVPACGSASEEDWSTEYLDLVINAKQVSSLDEAVGHINRYGSHHTDSIVTPDAANAERFLQRVDSAAVFWNASTRFTDGGEFGLGAEIGISTDKLHCRGPMGLVELTTYKWIGRGTGQIRG
jgi:glutamate-5-semialdehyde dehydrogenase